MFVTTPFGADIKQRRSIRLQGYDYTKAGAYFVTVCTIDRQCIFGEICDNDVVLSHLGKVVAACWLDIPKHYPSVDVDAFVVMPNHVHGIVVITDYADNANVMSPLPPKRPTLGQVVGSLKSASTKQINDLRGTQGETMWQRNYFERIIRREHELNRIREYIQYNPSNWLVDENNPLLSPNNL
jgi:REP element-mobilizing transposase RayT